MKQEYAEAIGKLFIAFSRIETLYDAIKHGDQEHQDWLKEAIDLHLQGKQVPEVRGKGNKEQTPDG